ncbi:MAG TPA: preprotein translocase subunit SecE [Candidatus Paceibacterota bacterium]
MAKIVEFVKETRTELGHVSWPSRQQTLRATALVIGISLGLAFFLAFFDWLFSLGLKSLIN